MVWVSLVNIGLAIYILPKKILPWAFLFRCPTSFYNQRAKKSFPNETVLVIISNTFAVSIDWLLGRIDSPYNESILTKLEEEHAVAIFEMAVATPITPLPEEYKNMKLRRKYYTQGQRANLIYAAMSSFYKTLFSMFTLKQIEKGEMDLRTLDDAICSRNILNGYVANIKDIRPLLYGELDVPVFDLEAAIKQHKNK